MFHVDANGIKINSRSLQEGFKMLQDAKQLPTGANMGPTWGPREAPRSVQGVINLVPMGSEARIPAKSRHGPQIDPKMDPKRTPNGFQNGPQLIPNEPKSTINPLQIGFKIEFQIDFMLTILLSTIPLGARLRRLFPHLSGVCLKSRIFWSQDFELF